MEDTPVRRSRSCTCVHTILPHRLPMEGALSAFPRNRCFVPLRQRVSKGSTFFIKQKEISLKRGSKHDY
jgi:hypothetical protein